MRRSIVIRIIISYILIILVSVLSAGWLFSSASRTFMEEQAEGKLLADAKIIEEFLVDNFNEGIFDFSIPGFTMHESWVRDTLESRINRNTGRLDSTYAILNKYNRVLYFNKSSNEQAGFNKYILPQISGKLGTETIKDMKINVDNAEYMMVITPNDPKTLKVLNGGWVILYTPVGPVDELNQNMLKALSASILVSGILMLIFGLIFARSITRPIIKLKVRTEMLAKRDFDTQLDIHTRDELEDLANTVNKMALDLKEYDIAQKKFLQNASHELKTPLMSIQGYAEGIRDGVFEDNDHALKVISEESTRLKRLVDELIYLSKLETMDNFYRFQFENINSILEQSVDKLNSLVIKGGIEIALNLSADMKLYVDKDKLIQALINILGNCLRYASSKIRIDTINDSKSLIIKITDDGKGFDDNEVKYVFERFYKGAKGNTGLGLSISKIIIERHGGTLTAGNSIETGGAEFIIKLQVK